MSQAHWPRHPVGLLLTPTQLELVIERFAGVNDPEGIKVLEQALALQASQAHRQP